MRASRRPLLPKSIQPLAAILALLMPLVPAATTVSPAEARPPDPVDLNSPSATGPLSTLSTESGIAYTSFYFEDFENGPAGWSSVSPPNPTPTYWNPLARGVHYEAGFEAPRFQPGLALGQDGWGTDPQITIQGAVVASGTQALMIDRTDGSQGTNAFRAVDLDAAGEVVDLSIQANLSSGFVSYWTVLHTGLADTWIGINVTPLNEVHVVFPGPDTHPTGQYISRDTWNRFDLQIDFVTRAATVSLNGSPIYSGSLPGVSNTIIYCQMGGQFPDRTDIGYFDDFSVSVAGAWWCGVDDPCLLQTPPGYGNNWDQRLEKTFEIPADNPVLEILHKYDTEWGYDFCRVEVSTDAGASYTELARFDGLPPTTGFIRSTWNLSAYAGLPVLISFHFTSDVGWSDGDGIYVTDGAWRIATVQVGSERDDFATGDDGWVAYASPPPPQWAAYRLESAPICGLGDCSWENGDSWVAYDPSSETVPILQPGQRVEAGIESPPIPLPASYEQLILDVTMYMNLPLNDLLFFGWQVKSTGPGLCPETRRPGILYYGISGWSCTLEASTFGRIDITDLVVPGATSIQLQLYLVDMRTVYTDISWSGEHSEGLYFDNIHLLAGNTSDPGIEAPDVCSPPGPDFVTVTGRVYSDCEASLLGIPVDLNVAGGMFTTTTDADGAFTIPDVPYSTDEGVVAIVVPLGFDAVTPPEGQLQVTPDQDQYVSFTLVCLQPRGSARTIGYWKHQANVYLNDRGHAQETLEDMAGTYPNAIFSHFYENGLNGIVVEGVTYMDPGTGDAPLDLDRIHTTLTVNRDATMLDRAKQQFLAFLLNVASGKLLTSSVVSEDGATASQALQQVAAMINDGNADNDESAKTISDLINNATLVPAGFIDLDITQIAYRPPIGKGPVLRVGPTPFRGATTVVFRLETAGLARVDIYDATGRLVRNVHNGWTDAGETRLAWTGSDDQGRELASGVYYVRVQTTSGDHSQPVVLLK